MSLHDLTRLLGHPTATSLHQHREHADPEAPGPPPQSVAGAGVEPGCVRKPTDGDVPGVPVVCGHGCSSGRTGRTDHLLGRLRGRGAAALPGLGGAERRGVVRKPQRGSGLLRFYRTKQYWGFDLLWYAYLQSEGLPPAVSVIASRWRPRRRAADGSTSTSVPGSGPPPPRLRLGRRGSRRATSTSPGGPPPDCKMRRDHRAQHARPPLRFPGSWRSTSTPRSRHIRIMRGTSTTTSRARYQLQRVDSHGEPRIASYTGNETRARYAIGDDGRYGSRPAAGQPTQTLLREQVIEHPRIRRVTSADIVSPSRVDGPTNARFA